MGAVYRAWDPEIERAVALKVLLLRAGVIPEDLSRFAREARSAGRLRHPGIVAIHDVGERDGDPYIVMELVPGETLKARLARGVPLRDVLGILHSVCLALDHAHGHGVLHRDVKPANVLIDPDGRTVLTDFGLAGDTCAQERLTMTGSSLGTPLYMAPEQVEGLPERLGAAVDLWAIGVILYESVTGRNPFAAPSVTEIFMRVLQDRPTPLRKLVRDVDRELAAVIERCLAHEPADRFPSARALADALSACADRIPADRATPARSPDDAGAGVASAQATELDRARPTPSARRKAPSARARPPSRPSPSGRSRASERVGAVWPTDDDGEGGEGGGGGAARRRGPLIALVAVAIVVTLVGVLLVAGMAPDDPVVRLIVPAEADLHTAVPRLSFEGVLESGELDAIWVGATGFAVEPDGTFAGTVQLDAGRARHEVVLAGERSGVPLATVVVHVDGNPPRITFDEPADGATIRELPAIVRGRVVDERIDTVQLAGRSEELTLTDDGAFEVTLDSLEEGETAIVVLARDLAGNETSGTLRLLHWTGERPSWDAHPDQLAYARDQGLPLTVGNALGMRFALVPPGTFLMGGAGDEHGDRKVTLTRGFYIGTTEVTNAWFRRFDASHACGPWPELGLSLEGPDRPVVRVGWGKAKAFCRWLGEQEGRPDLYRLPTEGEWERAARAGGATPFPWGDDPADAVHHANALDVVTHGIRKEKRPVCFPRDDGHRATAPVGSFRPNRFGLFDVAGNVYEMCADAYRPWPRGPLRDPHARGPDGSPRVMRGGAFHSVPIGCHPGRRDELLATWSRSGVFFVGFRVVREAR